jgi:glycosyltransferase involved in cell wall biosynthesis
MTKPTVTVVVTRYGEPDSLVLTCLKSLTMQVGVLIHVLFLDQKKSATVKKFCENVSTKEIVLEYIEIPTRSLSFARNYGLAHASTAYVVFCDSDCILPQNWASEIAQTFEQTGASIVGTKIIPRWEGSTRWYHHSRIIQEFYSLLDLSKERLRIPKIVGASFALNASKVRYIQYFDEAYGRKNGVLLGGEETDLCKRVTHDGGIIIYTPYTYAEHVVSKERTTLQWLLKRAYYGGLSRAMRRGTIEPFTTKKDLIDYCAMALIVPAYSLGYFYGKYKNRHV